MAAEPLVSGVWVLAGSGLRELVQFGQVHDDRVGVGPGHDPHRRLLGGRVDLLVNRVGGNEHEVARARFDDVLVTRWTDDRPPPTGVPTAAPTPTATSVAQGQTLFSDDFSNPNSGWLTEEDANDRVRYDAGEYEVAILRADYFVGSPAPRGACSECTVDVVATFRTADFAVAGLMLAESGG